jgi:hypothetical protein
MVRIAARNRTDGPDPAAGMGDKIFMEVMDHE